MSNENQKPQTPFANIRELISEDEMSRLINAAIDKAQVNLKDTKFENDSERAAAVDAEADRILFGNIQQALDNHKTFVHWKRPGYWFDKVLTGIVTGVVLFGAGAAALHFGKRNETSGDNAGSSEKGEKNPFQTTATERPMRPSRELKTA